MSTIKCLIVDDEPLARELIVSYCHHLPSLEVTDVCGNALDAKRILREKEIHLLFLDIHLPVLDGIGFLNTLKHPPQVIMTTAYKEYAVQAFDLAVCDYLVKPFSLERFIIGVDKAMERLGLATGAEGKAALEDHYFFIKTDGKVYRIEYSDLLFAEANGNYTKIITTSAGIMPSMAFSSLEKLLPSHQFIKVHRSFIINKSKIDRIEGNRIIINKHEIPIGKNFREDLFNRLGL
jgi:DNA-binding LytR/AlgR family response regulator